MSSDVKSILELNKREKKARDKKAKNEEKKKPEGVNREVFSLTNGVPPLMGTVDASTILKGKKRALNRKVDKWVWHKFTNPARTDGLQLSHWQKDKLKDEPYPFAKLNSKINIVKFTDEEYESMIKGLNNSYLDANETKISDSRPENWTKEETQYLWDLCDLYDLKFIVIHDRYDKKYQRTIEELKDRYYTIAKKLCEIRGDLEHPVVKKPYNYDYEVKRKYYLEKLFMRTKQQHEKERQIIEYIKKIDTKVKKLEKEEKNLEKILNEDKGGNMIRRQEEIDPKKPEKKENFAGAYLRSQRMLAPIPVSDKVQNQMDIILKEMEISPVEIIPTEKTVDMFDDIRKEILKMLSLHKHIKKRSEEIKNLDEKLKDLESFSKIVTPNNNSRNAQLQRNQSDTSAAQFVQPSMSRQSSHALAPENPAPSQSTVKSKSPAVPKGSKGGSGTKTSGTKRKPANSSQSGTKRARNN